MQLGRDADLLQVEDVESSDPRTLAKRDFKTCAFQGILSAGTLTLAASVIPVLGTFILGGVASVVTVCHLDISKWFELTGAYRLHVSPATQRLRPRNWSGTRHVSHEDKRPILPSDFHPSVYLSLNYLRQSLRIRQMRDLRCMGRK